MRQAFTTPIISQDRLQSGAELITRAVHSRTPDCFIDIHFDVIRSVFGDCKDTLVSLDDFKQLPLSDNWYFKMNCKGEGLKISFPARVTRRLIIKSTWVKCNRYDANCKCNDGPGN